MLNAKNEIELMEREVTDPPDDPCAGCHRSIQELDHGWPDPISEFCQECREAWWDAPTVEPETSFEAKVLLAALLAIGAVLGLAIRGCL